MYAVRESSRAKHLRITLYPDGEVLVTKPKRVTESQLRKFIEERREWIEKHQAAALRRLKRDGAPHEMPRLRQGTKAYKEAVKNTRRVVHERLQHFAAIYGYSYGTVAIRNQKSRWGSCSEKGNLNFNYKIGFLPPELADYIIVHELCHLKEMNHSKAFWDLVGTTIPNHRALRKEMRRYPLG